MQNIQITIIGGGLAGTETAWQLSEQFKKHKIDNYKIKLYEMRPVVKTPAHHTDNLAELVCSNSLGSEFLSTARGVLIHEMKLFNSLIINSAIEAKVPAGQALAVDRDKFAQIITNAIETNPRIELIREEITSLQNCFEGSKPLNINTLDSIDLQEGTEYLVIASGPLTSPKLATEIQALLSESSNNQEPKEEFLKFFDAASPILAADSINMDIAFKASRYGKGETDDYINCPFYSAEEYYKFQEELIKAEKHPQKDFEKKNVKFFEGCLPVEEIASRGKDTLRFGPLKPVGLEDPRYPGKKAFAVVQLRQDNVIGSLYNIVGFQTNLKWGEQKRIFSMIPGLENLDIVRYGVMHQNIYINSPKHLTSSLEVKKQPQVYFAGQITGVEGYTESAATGIIVAKSIIEKVNGVNSPEALSQESVLGALSHYIANADPKNFQPMNSNWGIININTENLDKQIRKSKKLRNEYLANRALEHIESYLR